MTIRQERTFKKNAKKMNNLIKFPQKNGRKNLKKWHETRKKKRKKIPFKFPPLKK